MAAVLTLLLIACLLRGTLCGKFMIALPQTLEVLSGSCVTIPCSFDIDENFESNLDGTCQAVWRQLDNNRYMFDSRNPQTSTISGELTGDLTKKDCTTILNNMQPVHSKTYYFRLECNNPLRFSFSNFGTINISVKAAPPRPTLTPSTLKVKEGTSVNFTCSAPAPCLSHPPALTWSPGLGEGQESLWENQDKTKVKLSVLTYTASHLHHGKNISCTATYSKLDGSTESAVSSFTADISCSEQQLGPYSGALLAVAVVSLSINVLLTTGMVFLWRARRNTRPKEQDQIYMSLDGRDQSPEYEVIARTPR